MGADPALTTLPRWEVDQGAAMRAAATVVPTVGREGRSEAASAAAGAAGKSSENSYSNENRVIFLMEILFFEKKNGETVKLKSKKNEN